MSSREIKRKKTTKNLSVAPTPIPMPSLPDDLMWSCFARVSRFYYPSLSLVSKSYQSLITSPELYENRSLLQNIETCLYVCLKFRPDDHPRWFTLCRKPDQTQTNKYNYKKLRCYLLASIPSLSSLPLPYCSCLVSLGSNIYKIGGPIDHKPSTSVSILDCRTHTWREGPSLLVKRLFPAASVVDGKIYVAGGCYENGDSESLNSIEVFDPKTQTWDQVPSPNPGWELSWGCLPRSACIEGKFHLVLGKRSLEYDPKKGKWDGFDMRLSYYWIWSYCTVDNVLVSFYKGHLQWYDTKVGYWKILNGLVGLPKFGTDDHVKLADSGGKMAVLWDMNLKVDGGGCKKKMLCCAEISLEKCYGGHGIWGIVEWIDRVLSVPDSYELVKVLAVTL